MEGCPEFAVVCGRRRERYPERTIYNRLADMEWNSPVGEARYCGGDLIIRADVFRAIGGFNASLIAGEDPDLAVRVRKAGWKILRVDADMTLHDMAMTRFSQWWRRSVRSGFAYADGAVRHGAPPERHWVREVRRIVVWGMALPAILILLAWPTRGWSLLGVLIYPAQIIRIARGRERSGMVRFDAYLFGTACVVGYFPQASGLIKYWTGWLVGRGPSLIEYKGPGGDVSAGKLGGATAEASS
jgi:hypothetical protein